MTQVVPFNAYPKTFLDIQTDIMPYINPIPELENHDDIPRSVWASLRSL